VSTEAEDCFNRPSNALQFTAKLWAVLNHIYILKWRSEATYLRKCSH
jgi:hypothetical protein